MPGFDSQPPIRKGRVELAKQETQEVPRVQLWLHRAEAPNYRAVVVRRDSSALARRLLGIALEANQISLPPAGLLRPALELFDAIRELSGLEVSLAHCRGLILAGLAPGRIGIDCERPGRNRSWREMAEAFFSAGEAEAIHNLPPDQWEAGFLQHWTLKESMIKATRGSVFNDLNRLVLEGTGEQTRVRTAERGNWFAWHGQLAGCSAGLVCSLPERPALQLFESPDLQSAIPCPENYCRRGPGHVRPLQLL